MNWQLHLGSCTHPMSGLAALEDESVDHAIFDPPYSEHVHASCRSGLTANNKSVRDVSQISQRKELGFAALDEATRSSVAHHAARVAKRWILVFSDVESCHLWREALVGAGAEYIRTVLWDKLGGAPQFTGDRPAVGFETITVAHAPGKKRWNARGKRGVYQVAWKTPDIYTHSIVLAQRGKEKRSHTTQKPEELMSALVRDFTDAGDLICDPFAGSGTTGVAALRAGRRFVGWECDEKYHREATQRLSLTREQLELLKAPPRKGSRAAQAALALGGIDER
jgi:DNA modification methylase